MADELWIWGRHPVLEALRAGSVTRVLLASERRPAPVLAEIRRAAQSQRVELREVASAEIDRLAPGESTQGVAALVHERRVQSLQDILDIATERHDIPFVVALDQVQDPHNAGALLRTANAAGVHGVIVPNRRSVSLAGVAARASAGAISHVAILEVTNLARTLEAAQAAQLWTVGLDADAVSSVYEVDLSVPVLLVLGSENVGLRRLVRERCDVIARLPMRGQVASLNVSVAGGIAMFEVLRQRFAAFNPSGSVP
jgi:23S rRNA (guanosine2251-2'-O)-methyltransferase